MLGKFLPLKEFGDRFQKKEIIECVKKAILKYVDAFKLTDLNKEIRT
jgi:hypothetical protein